MRKLHIFLPVLLLYVQISAVFGHFDEICPYYRPIGPDIEVVEEEISIYDLPAVVMVYDPSLGNGNCDGDCTTVATGPFEQSMYHTAGACDALLLGATVHFPDIGHTMECVDRGSAVKADYSEHFEEDVLYFDAIWPLEKVDGVILGAPDWTGWKLGNWYVTWDN